MIHTNLKKSNLHIYISGDIDDITATGVMDYIYGAENQDDIKSITIGINSYGGSVASAIDIINACKKSSKKVVTRIEGVAASSAFLVFLGCSKENREITTNAIAMMHDPSNGDTDTLNAFKSSISNYIAECSPWNNDEVDMMMARTTWLNCEQLVEAGIVDTLKVIKMDGKFRFNPLNKLVEFVNEKWQNIYNCKEDINNKQEIMDVEKEKEYNAIIDELKGQVELLSGELNSIKNAAEAERLAAEEAKIAAEKEALLSDVQDVEVKEVLNSLNVDAISKVLKGFKTAEPVSVKSPSIVVKNELKNTYQSLNGLSEEEKFELFQNNKEEYYKLFKGNK